MNFDKKMNIHFQANSMEGISLLTTKFFQIWECDKNYHSDKIIALGNYRINRNQNAPYIVNDFGKRKVSLSDHCMSQFICLSNDENIIAIGMDVEPKNRKMTSLLVDRMLSIPVSEENSKILETLTSEYHIGRELIIWCWCEALFKAGLNANVVLSDSETKDFVRSNNNYCIIVNGVVNFFIISDDWLVVVVVQK